VQMQRAAALDSHVRLELPNTSDEPRGEVLPFRTRARADRRGRAAGCV
jgi:hypothetical protein